MKLGQPLQAADYIVPAPRREMSDRFKDLINLAGEIEGVIAETMWNIALERSDANPAKEPECHLECLTLLEVRLLNIRDGVRNIYDLTK